MVMQLYNEEINELCMYGRKLPPDTRDWERLYHFAHTFDYVKKYGLPGIIENDFNPLILDEYSKTLLPDFEGHYQLCRFFLYVFNRYDYPEFNLWSAKRYWLDHELDRLSNWVRFGYFY